MSNNAAPKPKNGVTLSPVVERSRPGDGSGIIGFTVSTPDGRIKNFMEPFEASTREHALEKIKRLYSLYEHSGNKH